MDFKDRLKYLREESGITSEELAKKIGVSRSAIGNYEIGLRKPRPEQQEALADVFNVDLDYLMGRSDKRLKTSFEEARISYLLRKLNDLGKREATKRVEELTYISKYQTDSSADHLTVQAAHARTDIEHTPEGKAHDDAIMDDDSEWE